MNLSFLISSMKTGGAERAVLTLAKELKKKGVNIQLILLSSEGEYFDEARSHFRIIVIKKKTFILPFYLFSVLRRSNSQFLISSFWKLNLVACVTKIFLPKLKVFVWEHSPPSKTSISPTFWFFLSASLLYPLAEKIITVSQFVANDINRHSIGLRNRTYPIFNPISPPKINRNNYVVKHMKGNVSRLIFVGRLEADKNIETIINAVAILNKRKRISLNIVGDGAERKRLEFLVKSLVLENIVSFHGHSLDPYEQMSNAEILVMSSIIEGLPTVMVEALYLGMGVACTNIPGGMIEILENGKFGTIAEECNASSLAVAIEIEILKKRKNLTQSAAASRFKPEHIAKKFHSILK